MTTITERKPAPSTSTTDTIPTANLTAVLAAFNAANLASNYIERGNFTAAEYTELLLKTLRRWVLTYWRSPDRAVILDCLKRGLREGLGQRPAANAELLAGNPEIVAAIDDIEISAVES